MSARHVVKLLVGTGVLCSVALLCAPAASAGTISRPVFHSGLVGYWNFDVGVGGTTAYDMSGQGTNGTLTNMEATDWVDGTDGQRRALDLDGDNEFVDLGSIGASSPLRLNGSAATFTFWFKHDQFGDTFQRVIDKSDGASASNGYAIWVGAQDGTTRGLGASVNGANWRTDNVEYEFGVWTHGAIVVTAAGEISAYVNGEPAPGAFYTGSATPFPDATTNMRIGSWNHSTNREFDGSLDDVRVYNRALTASEISRLHQVSGPRVGVVPVSDGLVGYWSMDVGKGGFTAYDMQASNHGTLTNMDATDWVDGLPGRGAALDFDGSNDFLTLGDPADGSLDFGTGDFAGCAWIQSTESTTDTIMGKRTSGGNGWLFRRDGSGQRLNLRVDDGPEPDYYSTTLVDLSDGEWHHTCFSADRSGDVTFYIDGVDVGGADMSSSSGSLSNSNPFCIAANNCDSSLVNIFDGAIDEVRIYNRTITAEEVARLAKLTRPQVNVTAPAVTDGLLAHWTLDGPDTLTNIRDRGPNGLHGGITVATSSLQRIGKVGQAFYFDATHDGVEAPDSGNVLGIQNTTRTIATWINWDGGSSGSIAIAAKENEWGSFIITSTGRLAVIFYGSNTGSSGPVVATNEWHHAVVSWNELTGYWEIYYDGEFVTSGTNTNQSSNTGNDFGIGSDGNGNRFSGMIDDVRVYDRLLTADEVRRIYELGN